MSLLGNNLIEMQSESVSALSSVSMRVDSGVSIHRQQQPITYDPSEESVKIQKGDENTTC